jgi:integrase
LLLYTAKTNTPVHLQLPKEIIAALDALGETGEYFFWPGRGGVKAATSGMQRTLYRLFRLAGVKGHAHQFRDSFAVELLQKGVSPGNVATLLGNTVKIAEKHYALWIKSRQDALTSEIEKAWKL